jgi:hypothetical protein
MIYWLIARTIVWKRQRYINGLLCLKHKVIVAQSVVVNLMGASWLDPLHIESAACRQTQQEFFAPVNEFSRVIMNSEADLAGYHTVCGLE